MGRSLRFVLGALYDASLQASFERFGAVARRLLAALSCCDRTLTICSGATIALAAQALGVYRIRTLGIS